MVSELQQGDIALVPFPYSDLTSSKVRPVLVISNQSLNKHGDFFGVAISTKKNKKFHSIEISENDLSVGKIREKSFAHPQRIHTLERKLVHKVVAQVNRKCVQNIWKCLQSYCSG